MSEHLPVLIVVVPLSAAFVVPLLGRRSSGAAHIVTLGALAATLVAASVALARVLRTADGVWRYELGGWAPPWGIEYVLDPLSGGMSVLVAGLALAAAIYAGPYLRTADPDRIGLFDSLYLLLVAGLLGIVVTGDLFNLYVFLEISAIAAYALLSTGGDRAAVATFRYLLVGTVAASCYLLGIGYLYALTGTLNMADLSVRLAAADESTATAVGVGLIVIGLAIKAAVFPFHGWLPDAYTYAPPPVTGFVAAVMTKVSAYALYRVLYFVLGAEPAAASALVFLGWAGVAAIVAGSWLALAQSDVRRMLAYSSVGQMGYIIFGFSLGSPIAIVGALFHVLNHALMKGCLFLVTGGIRWRTGVSSVAGFAGLGRRLPLSATAFALAAVSMVGLPPTAGFFSKWYLLLGAFEAEAWVGVAALVGSSWLSAIYFFRVLERLFVGADETTPAPERRDLPFGMLAPALALAVVVLLLGLFHQPVVTHLLERALPPTVS
ncbi:MAG: monovalent cation/H+ antiporter subunit D family protein [Vicinamibacterales bacterium]|jgi:multicomponent Na+:H+ antiporter subunit D|nr:hypothetical protein [Acidobacteriota bacterium]MDP7470871.1 monovalent cation/H+ antiporter subunit D family protein [Vicinamibacterales bacterium]MDP7670961.1 monovalent cation/H+ antiporter subunit D family protein [Vicinamibacterales bacterium]HJO39705.1 monovalent cation/H+ antiporter subunit D family protein [Vicinamibacterales bacterium]